MSQATVSDDEFVAFRVRYELKRQGKPARVLVRGLEVTDNYISRRLRGETPFTAVELAQVAKILDVEIGVFFPPGSLAAADHADDDADEGDDQAEDPDGPRGRSKNHGRSVRRGGRRRGPVSETGRRRA